MSCHVALPPIPPISYNWALLFLLNSSHVFGLQSGTFVFFRRELHFSPHLLSMHRCAAGLWVPNESCGTAGRMLASLDHLCICRVFQACTRNAIMEVQNPPCFCTCMENHLCMHRCTEGLCQDPKAEQGPLVHLSMCQNGRAWGGAEPLQSRTEVSF